MTSKILLSLYCLVAVCLLFSCTKDHWPPSLKKGDITGKVIMYDSMGVALSNHAGVLVTIDSTGLSAITDATGAYSFKKVKAGQYNFSYSKEGYGTYRIIRQLHTGGTTATQLPDAEVGKIYDGPTVTSFDYFGLGSPNNPQIVTVTSFASPMRLPAASVLYMDTIPDLSKTNFRGYIRYAALQGIQDSMYYWTPDIDPHVIRADSVLLKARHLYFYLAFDNLRDIKYIDEQGRTIHPCTGKRLGAFQLYGALFEENPYSSRQTGDGTQLRFNQR